MAMGDGRHLDRPLAGCEPQQTVTLARLPVAAPDDFVLALFLRRWELRQRYKSEWHAGRNLSFDRDGNLRLLESGQFRSV